MVFVAHGRKAVAAFAVTGWRLWAFMDLVGFVCNARCALGFLKVDKL